MLKNSINTFFNDLLHLFYPELCAGCGSDLLAKGRLLCGSCIESLPLTDFVSQPDNPVEKIFWGRMQINAAAAYAFFTKGSLIQILLHQLKYRSRPEVGHFLGRKMGEAMLRASRFNGINAIVPVPLQRTKQRLRGYNQAEMICTGIAEVLGMPVTTGVLLRARGAQSQTNKGRGERWINAEGNFRIGDMEPLIGRHILLVDDVITTGSTVEACGAELLKIPGVRVSIMSLAYTL